MLTIIITKILFCKHEIFLDFLEFLADSITLPYLFNDRVPQIELVREILSNYVHSGTTAGGHVDDWFQI